MSDFITRFVWFDETGKIIVKNNEYQHLLKCEKVACVLLVGPAQYVERLVARIKEQES